MDPSIGWPLSRNRIRRGAVSNTFGMVRRRADGSPRPHQGWDFEAAIGTSCRAIANGRVALVSSLGDYGKLVAISFAFEGDTLFAVYAHLKSIDVAMGDAVTKGQIIGQTGDTGNAKGMTGADLHLHFEIRTIAQPGRGLAGRMSPLHIFRQVPLDQAVVA